jgi:type III pantothenate kinase
VNLIIDVGNTQVKVALFKDKKMVLKTVCDSESCMHVLKDLNRQHNTICNAIISSVGALNEDLLTWIKTNFNTLVLDTSLKIPFINNYATPNTLGVDRIALVSAAAVQFPNKNCLIIDAGSCITYDFLDSENQYWGGAISPGVVMRYRSLNTFTENLPYLDKKKGNTFIGSSTQEAIHVGVVQGILFEIAGYITRYSKEYKDLTVILTGGDAHFLLDSLNFNIFANSNFLLEGLNHILEHNIN